MSTTIIGASDRAFALLPTTVQSGAITATAQQLIRVNATSAAGAVTLPAAPADRTLIGVKIIAGLKGATITASGSDVFDVAGGATSLSLSMQYQGVLLQYDATEALWIATADNLTLGQLDDRYLTGVNVLSYGAAGNGTADDTSAILAALNAMVSFGGNVYLPAGEYLVSASITPPPTVCLVGQTAITLNQFSAPGTISRLIASSSWAPSSSAGVVQFESKTPGGWSTNLYSCGLRNIFIDCSQNTNTNLQGINHIGPTYDVSLVDVFIWKAPHNGITASGQTESGISPTYPYHQRYTRVSAVNCGNVGFNVVNMTDSTFDNCLAFGNANAAGWNISNCSNSVWSSCRSEWNEYGFSISSSAGTMTFNGCTTDQNSREGLLISSATGQAAQGGGIVWNGGKFHADAWAAASGHTNGVQITGSPVPVTITGALVESGQNVNNSGWFPATALSISTSSNITVTGCDLQGITAAWSWDGAGIVKRHGCIGMTGDPSSQVAVALPDLPYGPSAVPQDQNLLAWNYDPNVGGSGTAMPTAGTGYMMAVPVREQISVTNIVMYCTTAGATLTASECFAVLYNSSGTKIGATADQSSAWTSTGTKTMALSGGPYTLPPGLYYVQVFFNGTTGPAWLRSGLASTAAAAEPANSTAATFRYAVNGTGLIAVPASATLSSNAHSGAEQYWVGLN